jgi:CHASE2 domain-containing sensor protein
MRPRLAEYTVLLVTVPGTLLAILGCWYWFRHDRSLCYILAFTVLYFLLISAGAEAYSRFRVPVMPMVALLVGGGAAMVVELWTHSARPGRNHTSKQPTI